MPGAGAVPPSVETVRALDAQTCPVGRHHGGAAQGRQGRVAPGLEAGLGPAQHLGEPALADAQTEQVEEGLLQTLVGQGLGGLQVHGRGVQTWAEGRRSGADTRARPPGTPRLSAGSARRGAPPPTVRSARVR